MRIAAVVTILAALVACANTGPVQIGKDTYTISVRVPFSGPSGAKGEAFKEANTFCEAQNKRVLLQTQNSYECALHGGCGEAEITFLCLDESDPRYTAQSRPASAPSVSTGTGFAIHNPATLITSFHVIEGVRSIDVICAAGKHTAAIVERVDPANDLALLKLSVPAPTHLELAPENSVAIGQKVFTIGFPVPGLLGTEAKYSDGAISSLSGLSGAANLLQVTVPSQPGNSGGPLADESGRLVGVVTSTAAVQGFLRRTGTLPQNINWAVRSEYVRPLLSGVPLQQAQAHSSAVERVRQSTCMVRAIGT